MESGPLFDPIDLPFSIKKTVKENVNIRRSDIVKCWDMQGKDKENVTTIEQLRYRGIESDIALSQYFGQGGFFAYIYDLLPNDPKVVLALVSGWNRELAGCCGMSFMHGVSARVVWVEENGFLRNYYYSDKPLADIEVSFRKKLASAMLQVFIGQNRYCIDADSRISQIYTEAYKARSWLWPPISYAEVSNANPNILKFVGKSPSSHGTTSLYNFIFNKICVHDESIKVVQDEDIIKSIKLTGYKNVDSTGVPMTTEPVPKWYRELQEEDIKNGRSAKAKQAFSWS